MKQRLEYRQGAEWQRDTVRELVRDERLSPDIANRWHRCRFRRTFVEPSRLGELLLQQDSWPLTLAVLYIAYGGNLNAVQREWTQFIDWDKGLWLATKKPDQIMSLEVAESTIWTAFRTGKLDLLYPTASRMQRIDPLNLLRLRQIKPWRDHRLSYDGINVARDADMVPLSHVEIEREKLQLTFGAKTEQAPRILDQGESDYSTGAPGRPGSAHLIKTKAEQRAERGEMLPTLREEAKILAAWLKQTHPSAATNTEQTIENTIRKIFQKARPASAGRP